MIEGQGELGSGTTNRDRRLGIVYAIFFLSGFPALIYQIVWQRSLFTIYGVNIESITVIVTAFMLGLGLGSLLGGAISKSHRVPALAVFGAIELGIGLFGFFSLRLFDWVGALTLGGSGPKTFLASFTLVLIPTLLMGATLPLLVVYLVRRSGNVGRSVGILYFVNTLGSAAACFVCGSWLLGALGMKGSVAVACLVNLCVGVGAFAVYVAGRNKQGVTTHVPPSAEAPGPVAGSAGPQGFVAFPLAIVLVAVSGYISLSYEIVWVRVYSFLTEGRAASFPLLLGAFLTGIAFGSLASRRFCRDAGGEGTRSRVMALAGFVFLVTVIGFFVTPAVAVAMMHTWRWTVTLPAVALAAAMLGATLPLISHVGISPDDRAGARLSYLYVANIVGSAGGSFVTGFILMDRWSLRGISVFLAVLGLALCASLLFIGEVRGRFPMGRAAVVVAAAVVVVLLSGPLFDTAYERLQGKHRWSGERFAHVVETRSGVITVETDGTIYGGGVYDGVFNVDILHDVNGAVRPFALSLIHANPRHVLMIGLSSGSWAQIVANHPQVERLTIVEINPGYLILIPLYPAVKSLLSNPKVDIVIDDGRRWLHRNEGRRFDAIVNNNSFHWRSSTTNLLSVEFLELLRRHLKPGGIAFYNTTQSLEVQRTAALTFPYAVRLQNFMVVSDGPIDVDVDRWMNALKAYRIDGEPVLDLSKPGHRQRLEQLRGQASAIGGSVGVNAETAWLESRDSILTRSAGYRTVTDDNMGTEWSQPIPPPISPGFLGRRSAPTTRRDESR